MTPEKILSVVALYRREFETRVIPKGRMDTTVRSVLTTDQMLSHAHYLLDGIEESVLDPEKWGKANRHLGFVQALLCFSGAYSLRDLMDHNRSNL